MQRIGDAERDAAVEALREHMSVGRLSLEEFDERMNRVLEAKTQADLASQFYDLPGGAPHGELVPFADEQARKRVAANRKSSNALDTMRIGGTILIWLAFLFGWFVLGVPWWLFWIPMIITGVINDTDKKR